MAIDPTEPSASLSPLALRRRAASQRRLQAEGIGLPPHLPAALDEEQVQLRPAGEVARRALALFLVALRAETWGDGQPIPVAEMEERQPVGFAALSSYERRFLLSDRPAERDVIELSWRYEALQTLLWALGLAELPAATETADVDALVGLLLEVDEEDMVAGAHLRLPTILLDALDLHRLYYEVVQQARLERREPSGGLNAGVVTERHHALRWLARSPDREWDELETPA